MDDSALCKLLSSSTFRKFVHRSELEDEVSNLVDFPISLPPSHSSPTSSHGRSLLSFNKSGAASELENLSLLIGMMVTLMFQVFVLHRQLQQEVELHTSLERAFAHASGALPNIVPRDLPVNVSSSFLSANYLKSDGLSLSLSPSLSLSCSWSCRRRNCCPTSQP